MKTFKLIFIFLFVYSFSFAQNTKHAFWDEIQAFNKQDSINMPAKGQILFVGSSSFTKWKDVQDYFPNHKILNRGFGGSTLQDVIYYTDVIFKYDPKQIVIYCGENDLAASDTVTAQLVCDRFKKLFNDIRNKWQKVPVIFISIKPSPSRWRLKDKIIEANVLISDFLKKKKKTVFIDVYHKMLGTDGTPLPDIFIEDKLHMNAKGYAIWQKELEPYLLKD
jgi:lysophospholipase L1-like esterase